MNIERQNKSTGKRASAKFTGRVTELRKSKRMTQAEFVEKLNIEIDTLRKIEQQKLGLSLDVACNIADEYDVSLDWLTGNSDDMIDTAKVKLSYLDNLFGVSKETRESIQDVGQLNDKDYLVLSVEDEFFQLLIGRVEATSQVLPDIARKGWIAELRKRYNHNTEGVDEKDKRRTKFALIPLIGD